MDLFAILISILDSAVRLSVPLMLAALAGLYSERSGIFDIGLEGKMLVGAFAAGTVASIMGSAWLGLVAAIFVSVLFALVHGFASITARGNQIVSGVAINFLASGLTALLGQAWFGEGGRTPQLGNDARFLPVHLPGADAVRDVPILGPLYADLLSGHNLIVYLSFLVGAADRLDRLPHALRSAPPRRRREPGGGRHRRHLGRVAALPRRHHHRRSSAASPAAISRSRSRPASAAT